MLYAIRDLFTPPQIQDTRRKQQASLVYAAIVLTVVLSITGMLAGAFINSGNWRVLLTDAIIIALELFSLWILSRGRVQLSAWLLISGQWLGIMVFIVLAGGINAPGIMLLTVLTTTAALVSGWRGNVIITGASLVVVSALFILEISGQMPPPRLRTNAFSTWVLATLALVSTSVFLNLAMQHLSEALDRARQQEKSLEATLEKLKHTSVSRTYMDSVIQSMLDMLIVLDEDLRIITVNQSATEQLGYLQAELIGQPLSVILGAESVTLPVRIARLLTDRSAAFHATTTYRTRGGDTLSVDFTASRLRSNAEEKQIVCVAHDVTERIQATEALRTSKERLRASEERLRTVVTSAPVFIFAIDNDYNITFFDGQGLDEIDIEQVGRVLGQSIFLPPAGDNGELKVADGVTRALEGESVKTTVTVPPLTFDIRYSPIVEPDGHISGITGVATDITDRKRAEDALRESEARNRALLAAMPDAMLTLTRAGIVTDYKPTEILQPSIPREEIIGYPLSQVIPLDDPVAQIMDAVTDCLDSDFRHTTEITLQRDADNATILEARFVPLDENEALVILRDVTEARQAQTEIRQKSLELQRFAENLERSNQQLEQFAYVASHDLQAPLRKIQAFGSRIRQHNGDDLDETVDDYVGRMIDAANRMQSLIRDLLTFSRVTTQAQPFEPIDLNAVMDGVLDDLELYIEQTGAQITVDDLPTIDAEQHQIRQLFQNLISNALKYTHHGQSPVVTVRTRPLETKWHTYIQIEVEDNGLGFEQEHAERIFGVFQRLHGRSSPYEGTGMGLAICRKIVERHNGTIQATGRKGQGATFTVTLPVKQP